jgi:hypothetical protein
LSRDAEGKEIDFSDLQLLARSDSPDLADAVIAFLEQGDPAPKGDPPPNTLTVDGLKAALRDPGLRWKAPAERRKHAQDTWARFLQQPDLTPPPRFRLPELLLSIYQRGSAQGRAALIDIIRRAPLRFGLWAGLKRIYKLAEVRLDAEVFGALVHFRGQQVYVATGPRVLPQGAPTSPALTNALCMRLDRRLSGLARTLGMRYTRYADDLTFSWRPPEGSDKANYHAPVGALLREAREVVTTEGFRLKDDKTRVLRAGDRQKITGLVINGEKGAAPARVPREVLRRLRAALHNREKGLPGKEGETLEQLQGMAAFVYMTDPEKGKALLQRIAALRAPQG